MGRASRKKNRPRGQAGGLYSQIGYMNPKTIKQLKNYEKMGISKETVERHMYNTFKRRSEDKIIAGNKHPELTVDSIYISYLTLLYKNYHNIYISSENVVDFVENNKIKDADFEKVFEIMISKLTPKDINVKPCKHKIENKYYPIALHFINRKDSVVSNIFILKQEKYMSILSDTGISLFQAESGIKNVNTLDLKSFNTIFNTFLFMDAFPESVKQGPPPVKMYGGKVSANNTIIGESNVIREIYRNGITPHMRRGHFRFLQSDRYKGKRYQTVYVKPTMVKGHAEHIVEAS